MARGFLTIRLRQFWLSKICDSILRGDSWLAFVRSKIKIDLFV